jgi:TonB-dependent starch-binding outer membrane protein SusC
MTKKLLLGFFALMLLSLSSFAQSLATGKVVDDKGAGISGASVTEKGTKNATATTNDGSYSLKVKTATAKLVIKAVGFEDMDVLAGSGTTMLKPDAKTLTDVVVTGTGVATSRKKVAISVESISADKLPAAPTASIDQALVGKVAGAQISSVDGTPGAKTNILLRGINSIQGGTQPMILYDGVEIANTDISSLDLSGIEKVEIVQGSASATLYGAQGANGVIQLISKKGKNGKTNIDVSTSISNGVYINSGDVHKSRLHSYKTDATGNAINGAGNIIQLTPYGTYAGVTWANSAGSFVSAMGNPANISNKPYVGNLAYYDHFNQFFQSATTTNTSININGGNGKNDFAFTLSNNHQESNIKNNGFVDRTNFTINLGTELAKGLKFRSLTQLVYTKNTLNPSFGVGGNNIYYVLNSTPFYNLEQTLADGTHPLRLTTGTVSVNGQNPFYFTDYQTGIDSKIDVVQNFNLNYKLNKFIELDAKYGINHQKNDINWVYKNQSTNLSSIQWNSGGRGSGWSGRFNENDNTGEIVSQAFANTNQNFITSLVIRTDFEKDFKIKIPLTTSTMVAYDYRKSYSEQLITYGLSLPLNPPLNFNSTSTQYVANATQLFNAGLGDNVIGGDYKSTFISYGVLVNQRFDYGDYGGFSLGLRSDYSSAFGGGSKPQTFPRADAYFRPSTLSIFKNNKIADIISEWKVRMAYGEAGIQPGVYQRQITLNNSSIGNVGAYSLPYATNNPSLNVELSKEFEIGTDLSLNGSKGRWFKTFNFSISVWNRSTDNGIYDQGTAPSFGANSKISNTITMSSNGIQASLSINLLKTKNWNWDLTTNFTKQSSMIDKINGADIALTASAGSTSLVLTPGQKIGQLSGYKAFKSLNETMKDGTRYIAEADKGKYQIVNGYVVDTLTKGIQFTNEAYSFGDPNPNFNASFINTITYKDFFTLAFQFDWVNGSHLYNQTKEWMYRDGIHSDYDKKVSIAGKTEAYTAYYRSVYADYFGVQNGARNATKDYFYEDASFVRLRNVSVAIDFAKCFNIKAFRKLQLVFTGRNLLTFTKYTGFDPEISSSLNGNSSWDRGIDHNSMPNIKSYQVGLNIGL